MIKEKPVMKVEPAGLSPMFPVITDGGTVDMPLLASTTKPAAESKLTGAGDVALADICENEWITADELKFSMKHLHELAQSLEGYPTLMKRYSQ